MTSLRYLLTFAPMLDNFKSHVFNRHEIRGFNSTMINYCNENVLKKISTNFFLMAVFEKLALEITKRALSIAFYPDSYVFMCFGIVRVYLRSEACKCTRVICKTKE